MVRPYKRRNSRGFARIQPASLTVRVRIGDTEYSQEATFCCDISTSGLGIELYGAAADLRQKLTSSIDPAKISIDLPDGQIAEMDAQIMWDRHVDSDDEPHYRLGMQFLDMDPKTKRQINGLVKWMVMGAGRPEDYNPDDGV